MLELYMQTTKLKSIYEAELSEARRLLDETSKEKAQLALDKANYADKLNDATKELVFFMKYFLLLSFRRNENT